MASLCISRCCAASSGHYRVGNVSNLLSKFLSFQDSKRLDWHPGTSKEQVLRLFYWLGILQPALENSNSLMPQFICIGYSSSALVGTSSALTASHCGRSLPVPRSHQEQLLQSQEQVVELFLPGTGTSVEMFSACSCPCSGVLVSPRVWRSICSCPQLALGMVCALFLGSFLPVLGGIPTLCSCPFKSVLICSALFQGNLSTG